MAPKTEEDIKLAQIKADLEKAKYICITIATCVLGILGTICISMIVWAIVQITDKPAWLEFALAILGSLGAPSLVSWRLWLRLKHCQELLDKPGEDGEGGTSS
jgi:hypothetical protein